MSILGSIISSVLARPEAPHAPAHSAASSAPPAHTEQPPRAPPPTPTRVVAPQVDVAAVLDKLAKEAGQKLDWRTSIMDLMKLLKLDSSLAARKTLAKELSYTGDTKDSATMNVWLHKQVMAKLAQGGGKLPDDLKPDRPH